MRIVDAALELVGSRTPNHRAVLPSSSATNLTSLVRFAWFVLFYNIAVIIWGAYVRATGSGAGCGSHWPLCNGEIVPKVARVQTLIEFTHRITSGLSLLLVLVLLAWCWRSTRKGDWARYSAAAATVLLFNEAILGAMLVIFDHVGLDRSASRAVFLCLHFGNTLLLVAALTLTAKWLAKADRPLVPFGGKSRWFVVGTGLTSVMITGMTGSLAALGDTIFPSTNLQASIAQDLSSSSHFLLKLRLFHPVVAAIAFFYVLWMAQRLSKGEHGSPGILPFLSAALLAQVALGVLNVFLLAPVWLQLVHLLGAEIFWILLVAASADALFREAPLAV